MSRTLNELTEVNWSALKGAYGPSRPDVGATDVATHLKALVSDDEDTFEDALWGGLGAHVLHQGDIYDVTPFVVPFVVGIVDNRSLPRRGDVASFLLEMGNSACRYARSADEDHRALGERTRRALLDDAPSLERWWRDEDERVAEVDITLAWLLEELREPLARHVSSLTRPPTAAELTALALLPEFRDEAWAANAAASVARDVAAPRPARVAAALLLQHSRREIPADIAPFVDELTAPQERTLLSTVFDIPEFAFPLRSGPKTLDAEVVFAGPALFLARTPDGRQFTVRWPSSGLRKGDAVRLAHISTTGMAQSVEIGLGTADSATRHFDGRGMPIA